MSGSPDMGAPTSLVQRLAELLAHALPVSPALAVVLAFLVAGAAVVALAGGLTLILFRPKE